MQEARTFHLTFSRQEVVEALKAHFKLPAVQAMPLGAEFDIQGNSAALKVSWVRRMETPFGEDGPEAFHKRVVAQRG